MAKYQDHQSGEQKRIRVGYIELVRIGSLPHHLVRKSVAAGFEAGSATATVMDTFRPSG